MKKYGLVSNYTIKQFKIKKATTNNEPIPNIVNREFNNRTPKEVVVSDLTYIKVGDKWHYICLLLELSAREIIGYAAGKNKDAELVKTAFYTVKGDLRNIQIFHSDRGAEFKNKVIDEITRAFDIQSSLSTKGCPYDNAVAESMYSIIKTEFTFGKEFKTLAELEIALFDYVNWYNNVSLHVSLGYPPAEYKRFLAS